MKFGKYLEGRELELPEYAGYFMDYKALKKLIKQLSLPNGDVSLNTGDVNSINFHSNDNPFQDPNSYKRLQNNKASFFFKLERELEKVNSFYLQKESDLKIKFNILYSKYVNYRSNGRLNSRNSLTFKSIYGRFIKFQKDLIAFEQYVELNKTGFSKALKKWDKRSHSQDKDFYLATVVSVQPVFTRIDISKLNDETLNILMELNDLQNNNTTNDDNSTNLENKRTTLANGTPSTVISTRTPLVDSFKYDLSPMNLTTPSEAFVTTPNVLNNYIDFDSEIEEWYLELINISKLKDDDRRKENLATFYSNKIAPFFNNVNDLSQDSKYSYNQPIVDLLSKLFLLLVGSKMKDSDLEIFYSTIKSMIDLGYLEEDDQTYSKKNILHQATHCSSDSRDFVIREVLKTLSQETLKILVNAVEIHKRTPLHFAAELGKLNCVQLLLSVRGIDHTINSIDDDYDSPLVLAIKNNHIDIIYELLKNHVVLKSLISPENFQFSPLLVACKYNNFKATQIILDIFKANGIDINTVVNTEGLGPLHVTSRLAEDTTDLLKLLIDHAVNPNGIDDFNKFSPIFYAIKACNVKAVKVLLHNGADIEITDEHGRDPMFYVLWESDVEVLNEFLPYMQKKCFKKKNEFNVVDTTLKTLQVPLLVDSFSLSGDELNDSDHSLNDIPDFALPPPIIPLKKYGHNYLIQKISVKLIFERNGKCIHLNSADETIVVPDAGRMTVISNYPDNLPRNIILHDSMGGNGSNYLGKCEEENIFEGSNEVIFQVDTLKDLVVDFEIYPEFGTRLIAKTTCMPFLFEKFNKNQQDEIFLPLFDSKLNNIGNFKFRYQIIFPYSGRPLQIDKYEPYWKSTSNNGNSGCGNSGSSIITNNLDTVISNDLTSFTLGNPLLKNATAANNNSNNSVINTQVPHYITSSSIYGSFTKIKIHCLEDGTLVTSPNCFIEFNGVKFLLSSLNKTQLNVLLSKDNLSDIKAEDIETETKLLDVVNTRTLLFKDLLQLIPYNLQLVIQVCYPTDNERELVVKDVSSETGLNKYIDRILFTVFEHERMLRHTFGILRSIIFSSCNWKVCSILNWKQPNFPVLLEMNSLILNDKYKDSRFILDTPHRLKSMIEQGEGEEKGVDMIDKKIHIREMVEFAVNNNLFGVIIPHVLLEICEKMGTTIKNQELLLIGSMYGNKDISMDYTDADRKVNGILVDSKLVINRDKL
ncbi:hypothetical protein RI543_004514 [Arxiozyma heterogenica]|uniref:Phosphate system positive regulatory protein PHO81 n=1 Tax=Arxiozyma heterogenica TaxID=278026 RepID=A0AAN8A7K2_9SACH|nr:hypothetical protein RI543_004514 [Kazachstania heterogenica]